jgi:hypothetical protein
VIAVAKTLDDFVGGLLPREVEEVLLDILDLEGPLLKGVLLDEILAHRSFGIISDARRVHRSRCTQRW